jgi:transposase
LDQAITCVLSRHHTRQATQNHTKWRPAVAVLKATYPSVVKTWVDAGFKNQFVEHAATLGIDAEVVPRNTETRGFHVAKRRWVVERTLGWLMPHRRLARDYETRPASSEAVRDTASLVRRKS